MITSDQNSKIKLTRALLTKSKTRQQEEKLVLEGVRLIEDVVFDQQYRPHFVLYDAEAVTDHPMLRRLQDKQIPCMDVEPRIFADLSETEHSQGFLVVVDTPTLPVLPDASLLVVLDGVSDPGNLGTILRTSAAAGADGVLFMPGTVDPFNPKAIRAGMGAHYRLPTETLSWETFAQDYGRGWHIWTAEVKSRNTTAYHKANWDDPTILIIGSEAHGISPEARQFAKRAVYIPMAAGVESLNASIATAILLFEIQRQRDKF